MSTKTLVKNSGIYSLIMLAQKGINFLLIPVLTIYLTPEDYGIVAVVTAINTFLNVFYLLGLHGSLNRFYYEYEKDLTMVKRLFSTIISFVLINSIIISAIILLARKWILYPFLDEIDFFPYMVLGMISTIFNPIFTIYQNSLQARQEGVKYGKNNLFFFLTNLILLLVGVISLKLGPKGVLGALAITNIVFFLYTIFSFLKELTFKVDGKILKMCLNYSLPLVPHTISGVATALIDRIILNKMTTTAFVGVYTLGSNFGSIIFLITSGVNQAFVPWFNKKIKQNDVKNIPKIASKLIIVYCLLALGVSFFSKEVISIVSPESYHSSWKVVPFIAFAFVYHGVYYFFAGALFYDIKGKGNRIIPIATISTAIFNVVLNFSLIPLFGILGAAIATLLSKLFLSVSLSFLYKKFVPIRYHLKFLLFFPTLFFLISMVSYIPNFDNYIFLIKLIIYSTTIVIAIFYFRRDLKNIITYRKINF